MDQEKIINCLHQLGKRIELLSENEWIEISQVAHSHNGWFDVPTVKQALFGICKFLEKDILTSFARTYKFSEFSSKIGIVMAGNIPGVGFHDLMCVLLSGNKAVVKLSSQDRMVMNFLIGQLNLIDQDFKSLIEITDRLVIDNLHGVIATGSDNSSRYFDQYFSKIPSLIRKNRTSVAVLNGNETKEQLEALGKDIYQFYGLGCRNVSKIYLPSSMRIEHVIDHLMKYDFLLDNNKFMNNCGYYRSIFLVNKDKHLDNGFSLFQESKEIHSPIAVLNYEFYEDIESVKSVLNDLSAKIQCVVGEGFVPFGRAQEPEIYDFADNVDTMRFLEQIPKS